MGRRVFRKFTDAETVCYVNPNKVFAVCEGTKENICYIIGGGQVLPVVGKIDDIIHTMETE
jgi:hypothetical protein